MQEKFYAKISSLIDENKYPRFSIIVGKRGGRMDTVAKQIANRMDIGYLILSDVKVDTIRKMISDAYNLHAPLVYIMPNADDMSVNAKNALLKVTEEPPNKAYFIMCLEDISNTLETIKSRGTVFQMNPYTPDEIQEYAKGMGVKGESLIDVASICDTPGEVDILIRTDVKLFVKYVKDAVENITKLPGSEVFNYFNKLAYKDEADKYDCILFLKAFQNYSLVSCIMKGTFIDVAVVSDVVSCTSRYLRDLKIKGIHKQMLAENWILEVRSIWKSQK